MENQIQIVSSDKLQTQSLLPNKYLEFIKTKEEFDILKAVYENPQLASDKENAQLCLIELLGKWKWYVGLADDTNPQELILISNYIIEHYPTITTAEIGLAIDLLMVSKYSVDIRHYGNFSISYVCEVINAYLIYRKTTLSDFLIKRQKYVQEQESKNEITPEDDMNLTKSIFSNFYKKYQESGEVNDMLNICYKHISKHKMMVFTKQIIDEALEYGKKKFAQQAEKNGLSINKYLEQSGLSKEEQEKKHSRNYCVAKFFENNTLEQVMDMINISQFTKK